MEKGLLKKIMNDLRNGAVIEISPNGGYLITFSPYALEVGYDNRIIEVIETLFKIGILKRKRLLNFEDGYDYEYKLKSRIR